MKVSARRETNNRGEEMKTLIKQLEESKKNYIKLIDEIIKNKKKFWLIESQRLMKKVVKINIQLIELKSMPDVKLKRSTGHKASFVIMDDVISINRISTTELSLKNLKEMLEKNK
jgi:hypothetical protein